MGEVLVRDVREKIELIPTVSQADVQLVFDPPWSQSMMSEAAKLALGVVIILIILKVLVSIISHCISITAQAADSFLDLFSIGITVVAVRMSVAPADEEHPFGHGKMEGVSALIQAFLVLGAGIYIIYSLKFLFFSYFNYIYTFF